MTQCAVDKHLGSRKCKAPYVVDREVGWVDCKTGESSKRLPDKVQSRCFWRRMPFSELQLQYPSLQQQQQVLDILGDMNFKQHTARLQRVWAALGVS